MELFGIILSIPGAFIASTLYRHFLLMARSKWPTIAPVLTAASCIVLAGIVAEWALLLLRGAVETRVVVGPVFYPTHLIVFVLGTPALINVLVLPSPCSHRASWFRTVPLATMLAFILVVQQYGVFEALYGIDGEDGRFSRVDPQ
jgi:hypothetical protein